MRPTDYCLGCDKFKNLTTYYVIPENKRYKFPLCYTCKWKLELLVSNMELQKGGWKEPIRLETVSYFRLLRDFIMGEQ